MSADRMQTRRFELKYRIDARQVPDIRRAVCAHLAPDEFGAAPERPEYEVHSLYFDSVDYSLCRATFHGERNRFKLRARYYRDDAAEPVYLEIKRREDRCIRKQRALVRREVMSGLLAGELPRMSWLVKPSSRSLADLETFCLLARRLGARPSAHVGYRREAWLSTGSDSVRVTFDRSVRCEPLRDLRFETEFRAASPVFDDGVVLEIKFTDRFPVWLRDLVARQGLQPTSAAKYADGLAVSGVARRDGRPLSPLLADLAGFVS